MWRVFHSCSVQVALAKDISKTVEALWVPAPKLPESVLGPISSISTVKEVRKASRTFVKIVQLEAKMLSTLT
jgi:hypothetical protein